LQLGHGPYVNGLGSRETSPSMSSSLPVLSRATGPTAASEQANGQARIGRSGRSVRKTAHRSPAAKRSTEKPSSKKPSKRKATPISPVQTTPRTPKSASLPKSTPKKARPKRASPRKPDVVSVPSRSRAVPRRRASQSSTPRRFPEQSAMGKVLDVITIDLDDVMPGPAKVIDKSEFRSGTGFVDRSAGNITRALGTFQENESSKELSEVAPTPQRSFPADLPSPSQASWPVTNTARPVQRSVTSGIPDIYSECGY
jgi:hypothetical protein